MKPQSDNSQREGHRARLRERYLKGGLSALAEYEIAELFLTLAIPRIDVKPIAKELLVKYKNVRGILDAAPEDLLKINGIGESSVSAIKLMKDLINLYHISELEEGGKDLSTISSISKYFKAKIGALRSEVLEMICFDAKLRLIPDGCLRLSEGSVSCAGVDIRKVVETAIRRGASSIAIAHNHPSGDPHPSFEDIRLTRRLSEACKPINLNLIEHVIVGRNACFSFRKDGQFDCLYDDSLEENRLRGRSRVAEELETLADDIEMRTQTEKEGKAS